MQARTWSLAGISILARSSPNSIRPALIGNAQIHAVGSGNRNRHLTPSVNTGRLLGTDRHTQPGLLRKQQPRYREYE